MAARHYLLISDAVAPLASGEAPLGVMGLSRALTGAGSVTVLSLSAPEAVAKVPGLARRLRTARVGGGVRELALFEGKAPLSQAQLMVAGAVGRDRVESAILLAEVLKNLGDDALTKADVVIGWGETAALALSLTTAPVRLFVVPSGRVSGPLSESETDLVAASDLSNSGRRVTSLAELGAAFANAIVVPSPSGGRFLESDPAFGERASDEPMVAVRFGCDDPPNDPGSDGALAANFSAKGLMGKTECRRATTKKYSLALGPRSLLLGCSPLSRGKGGEELLAALPALSKLDVAVLIPSAGDSDLLERARRLAIQSPGRLAILDDEEGQERVLRAAADAVLCADPDDRTCRAAGLAQRYGALPIAMDSGAARDYLVDYDFPSSTGSALLFGALDSYEIEAAVRRAVVLRAASDDFAPLVQRLMETAPRWAQTATAIEEISSTFG